MTQRIHITVEDETLARLNAEASRQERDRSNLVGRLLRRGLDDLKAKAGPPPKSRAVLVFDHLEARQGEMYAVGLCWWDGLYRITWPDRIAGDAHDESGWPVRHRWREVPR